MNNNSYKKDPFANEFGISVSGEVSLFQFCSDAGQFSNFNLQMTKLTGRILEPPSLEYKELGKKRNLVTINRGPKANLQDLVENIARGDMNVDTWILLFC